jgi:exosome complex component RRP43
MSQPISFPPDVLARVAPDISLKRHLASGLRPNLRNFTEFNPIEITSSPFIGERNAKVVGTSIVKGGKTTVMSTITLGIVENPTTTTTPSDKFTSVYPVVEIKRGRPGEPMDEEQIMSQSLYETILHAKLIPQSSLHIDNLGILLNDDNSEPTIYYPDINPDDFALLTSSSTKRSYSYVLLSNIKVLSKSVSTSSLFDMCYLATMNSLSNIKLPRAYLNVGSAGTKISMRARSSGKRGMVGLEKSRVFIDTNKCLKSPLVLAGLSSKSVDSMDIDHGQFDASGISSNFGVITYTTTEQDTETVLLADIEGEAEETAVFSRISVIANKDESIKKISLINGDIDSNITLEKLKEAIEIAKSRAKEFA